MKVNFLKLYICFATLTLFMSMLSCRSKTEKIVNIETVIFENGKRLEINKTDRNTSSIGIFSNHNYGVTHQYSYELTLDNDIDWIGGSHEPKQILFNEEDVYLRFLQKKRYNTSSIDSLTLETKTSHYYTTKENYQKHIDERYFFNWFGKDYWVNVDSLEYHSLRKAGQEFEIPNDEELILEK